jgi:hypothetical protein
MAPTSSVSWWTMPSLSKLPGMGRMAPAVDEKASA